MSPREFEFEETKCIYIIFLGHIIKTALFQGHQIICIKDTCLVWEFFSSSQQPSCFSLSLLSSTNALKNIFDRVTLILYHLVHGKVVEVGCWRSQSKLHRHLCHLQEPTLRQQICYWVLTPYNLVVYGLEFLSDFQHFGTKIF